MSRHHECPATPAEEPSARICAFPRATWPGRARPGISRNGTCFPHEVELELIGHLPAETLTRLRDAVVEYGLNAINHGKEHGGQGLTQLQQVLVNEEVGKATGALWAVLWHPPLPVPINNSVRSTRTSDFPEPERA